MKKSIIMFVVFFILDIVLFAVFENIHNGMYLFLPITFLEIAIYGSVIIYDISKLTEKKDDKKEDKKDD